MSFLIDCPLCGPRDVGEYRYGGELQARPAAGSTVVDWSRYLYDRENVAGVERAWWFHRAGCRRWFQAERDTRSNEVIKVGWRLGSPSTGVDGDG
jgi:heterotetrameric sarcosine oxidase delta subunit